jgi:hypothetical protein
VPAYRGLRTPRAAGIAGVLFSLLSGTSLVLSGTAFDPDPFVAIDGDGPAGWRVRVVMALMPRWLVVTTFLLALAMLVIVTLSLWVTLLFPAWVLAVSAYVLIRPSSAGEG